MIKTIYDVMLLDFYIKKIIYKLTTNTAIS